MDYVSEFKQYLHNPDDETLLLEVFELSMTYGLESQVLNTLHKHLGDGVWMRDALIRTIVEWDL